jgi:thiopeptide-type bacteriocin biosynthesis protein
MAEDGEWTNWHLHVDTYTPGVLDTVLLDVVRPVVTRLGANPRWFFVRYWQRGPHLRLRVRGLAADTAAQVGHDLRRRLALVNAGVPDAERIDRASYRTAVAAAAAAGENGRSLPIGALRRAGAYPARYEPEVERYGGPELMELSHELFTTASTLAVQLLAEQRRRQPAARLGTGLYATAAALAGLGTDLERCARFLRAREEYWLRWTAAGGTPVDRERHEAECLAAATRLAASPGRLLDLIARASGPAQTWADQLAAAVPEWRRRSATLPAEPILSSHLHMLLNRLGLGMAAELHVTGVLAEFLRLAVGATSQRGTTTSGGRR